MPVSVIIVSYNTCDLLRKCLQAVGTHDEIIVIDNHSKDGSAQMVEDEFPDVKLIKNKKNLGFGAANNQGLEIMTGDLVLLLNSDARPENGAIEKLVQQFEDEKVIVAGGRLNHPDGNLQDSACNNLTLWAVFCEQFYLEKIFKNSTLFSPYWVSSKLSSTGIHEVSQVMGACLMFRPKEKFDERFFLYCEDTELCKRLSKHGKILYVPEAVFVHKLGASSEGARWESVARYNYGKELYFEIHHSSLHRIICLMMNRWGACSRFCLWGFISLITLFTISRFTNQARLFAQVLLAPVNDPLRPIDND